MSLDIWSSLPKTQDNPQTIDEAIAAAIATHEADPESHMGEGESIENHRVNDVIDHPQGSVVSDKTSINQLELLTNFESSTGWTLNGTTHFYGFSGFHMESVTNLGDPTSAWFEDGVPVTCDHFSKNLLFQAVFSLYGAGNGKIRLNFSLFGDINYLLGIGFEINGTTLTGLFHNGTTLTTLNLLTLIKNVTYAVRAFANQATGNVEFWVNGNLIASTPFSQTYFGDENMSPYFDIHRTSVSGTAGLELNQLLISRDI